MITKHTEINVLNARIAELEAALALAVETNAKGGLEILRLGADLKSALENATHWMGRKEELQRKVDELDEAVKDLSEMQDHLNGIIEIRDHRIEELKTENAHLKLHNSRMVDGTFVPILEAEKQLLLEELEDTKQQLTDIDDGALVLEPIDKPDRLIDGLVVAGVNVDELYFIMLKGQCYRLPGPADVFVCEADAGMKSE